MRVSLYQSYHRTKSCRYFRIYQLFKICQTANKAIYRLSEAFTPLSGTADHKAVITASEGFKIAPRAFVGRTTLAHNRRILACSRISYSDARGILARSTTGAVFRQHHTILQNWYFSGDMRKKLPYGPECIRRQQKVEH